MSSSNNDTFLSSPASNIMKTEVIDTLIDTLLTNLGVISDLQEGDKLLYLSNGTLIIQKPGWYSTGLRTILRVSRWDACDHLYRVIKSALKLVNTSYDESLQITHALEQSLPGLANLCHTYQGDSPIVNRISVLMGHIKRILKHE